MFRKRKSDKESPDTTTTGIAEQPAPDAAADMPAAPATDAMISVAEPPAMPAIDAGAMATAPAPEANAGSNFAAKVGQKKPTVPDPFGIAKTTLPASASSRAGRIARWRSSLATAVPRTSRARPSSTR